MKRALQTVARLGMRAATLGLAKGPHITRYRMYEHLAQFRHDRDRDQRVLSISGSTALARLLGYTDEQTTELAFPEATLLNLPEEDGVYDAIVSDQVLEHVEGNPQRGIDESFRVLRSGGLALHTTCFINPIHLAPGDLWRFTPDALRLLVAPHGEIVDVGGWGNPWVWPYVGLGLRFEAIPHARWHPAHWLATHDSPTWPIVTWVLARKREAP